MAIQRYSESGGLERRVGLKAVAKKAAKHAVKKHAAKKHAAKHADKHAAKKTAKHAAKKSAGHGMDERLEKLAAQQSPPASEGYHHAELEMAFHHLHRAGAVISLLEKDSGGDLKMLLEHGIDLYRSASGSRRTVSTVRCAFGLLRAAEHLGMAGLYSARSNHRAKVPPPPESEVRAHLEALGPRLDGLPKNQRDGARRLEAMAKELLRRAEAASHDPHLEYELTMAADGICMALEEGM
jgi:hypothetical protein